MPIMITRIVTVWSNKTEKAILKFPNDNQKINEKKAVEEIHNCGASQKSEDDILDDFVAGREFQLILPGANCYVTIKWYWHGAKMLDRNPSQQG